MLSGLLSCARIGAAFPRLSRHFSRSSMASISFELSDESRAIQQLARDFAAKEMIPKAAEYDRTMEYPRDVFQKAWELNLVNAHIPEVRRL